MLIMVVAIGIRIPRSERVTTAIIIMPIISTITSIIAIWPCIYSFFSYDIYGIPDACGCRLAYLGCEHISFASRPVIRSGASLVSAFHTESSGNGRNFTIIHDIVPSFEIRRCASSGFE